MGISLKNKIVFITGASSGIGEACAKIFAAHGANLILCARRYERIQKLESALIAKHGIKCHIIKLDVRDREDVAKKIAALPAAWQNIDILINNAGLASGLSKIQEGDVEDWEKMIDTNIKGLLYVTRAILPGMLQRNAGHVINIGSVAGHEVYPNGNVYCATKYAVYALTKGLKLDTLGSNVRISSVDPGMVETEFSIVRFHGDNDRAKKVYTDIQPLTGDDVADAVYYCASRPAHVNILDVVMMTVAQSSTMHFYRTT